MPSRWAHQSSWKHNLVITMVCIQLIIKNPFTPLPLPPFSPESSQFNNQITLTSWAKDLPAPFTPQTKLWSSYIQGRSGTIFSLESIQCLLKDLHFSLFTPIRRSTLSFDPLIWLGWDFNKSSITIGDFQQTASTFFISISAKDDQVN